MIDALLEQNVIINADSVNLSGNLILPRKCRSAVIFAHGSGSSRHSPRNRFVAGKIHEAGIGTLLFDLLTPEEDTIYANRFNIELLSRRLTAATLWLWNRSEHDEFTLGYFGSSTGSAAALIASAEMGPLIRTVVSRGGRPDLADQFLPRVTSSVLLIVGGNDHPVLELNREAYNKIKTEKKLAIIPGATHLFEEPGTLDEVARIAAEWFTNHL